MKEKVLHFYENHVLRELKKSDITEIKDGLLSNTTTYLLSKVKTVLSDC